MAELFDFEANTWRLETLTALFDRDKVMAVLSLPNLIPFSDDQWISTADSKGIFSVANAYSITRRWSGNEHISLQAKEWDKFWKIQVQDRLKLFMWKCLHSALPLRGLIARFQSLGAPLLTICPLCGMDIEYAEHLFINCQVACVVWLEFPWPCF